MFKGMVVLWLGTIALFFAVNAVIITVQIVRELWQRRQIRCAREPHAYQPYFSLDQGEMCGWCHHPPSAPCHKVPRK